MKLGEALGLNLTKLRKSAGLTQKELGKEVGVSEQTIVNLEKGKTGFSASTIAELSRVLKVEETELVAATGASVESRVRALESQALPRELAELWSQLDDVDRNTLLRQMKMLVQKASNSKTVASKK